MGTVVKAGYGLYAAKESVPEVAVTSVAVDPVTDSRSNGPWPDCRCRRCDGAYGQVGASLAALRQPPPVVVGATEGAGLVTTEDRHRRRSRSRRGRCGVERRRRGGPSRGRRRQVEVNVSPLSAIESSVTGSYAYAEVEPTPRSGCRKRRRTGSPTAVARSERVGGRHRRGPPYRSTAICAYPYARDDGVCSVVAIRPGARRRAR